MGKVCKLAETDPQSTVLTLLVGFVVAACTVFSASKEQNFDLEAFFMMLLRVIRYPTSHLQSKHLKAERPLRQIRCFHCARSPGRPDLRSSTRAVTLITWQRGAKRSSKLKLNDLPQGVVPLEPLEVTNDEPAYPTVIKQVRENMDSFEHCVLLTRVGSFYEVGPEEAIAPSVAVTKLNGCCSSTSNTQRSMGRS